MLWVSYKIMCRWLVIFYLIILRHYGKEKFKKGQAYVLVSNHNSHLDILANALSSPVLFQFLGKKEAEKLPLFGYIYKNICILIDRKSKMSRARGLVEMGNALKNGMSIMIYPEGTRNKTGEPLKNFYDGAFRIAIQTQMPIMVQTLTNSGKLASPFRMLDMWPGSIGCHWDGPIETKGMTLDDVDELKEKVKAVMMSHLEPVGKKS